MADLPRFLDSAWQEVIEAANHHEDLAEGLGHQLYDEVEETLRRIMEFPLAGTPWDHTRLPRTIRRMPLRRLSYSLFYVVEPELVVMAFAHLRRRPGYWVDRLSE